MFSFSCFVGIVGLFSFSLGLCFAVFVGGSVGRSLVVVCFVVFLYFGLFFPVWFLLCLRVLAGCRGNRVFQSCSRDLGVVFAFSFFVFFNCFVRMVTFAGFLLFSSPQVFSGVTLVLCFARLCAHLFVVFLFCIVTGAGAFLWGFVVWLICVEFRSAVVWGFILWRGVF